MRHCLHFRILLALTALLAGTSSAAVALGHGISHAREAHESVHHHDLPGHQGEADGTAVHPAENHGHPILQSAIAKRLSDDLIVAPAPAVTALPFMAYRELGHSAPIPQYWAAARATGPPPHTRAPPRH